jgi:hypothetical protein
MYVTHGGTAETRLGGVVKGSDRNLEGEPVARRPKEGSPGEYFDRLETSLLPQQLRQWADSCLIGLV